MGEKSLEKRMYFLVPYNISPIQQAIQAGHAALEYAYDYHDDTDYKDFIENWKTWIILNGGTTNRTRIEETGTHVGSLDNILGELCDYNNNCSRPYDTIDFSTFFEPDLNDALTAVCLVVDERVFNREDYPDFNVWLDGQNPVWMSNNLGTYLVGEDEHRENYKEFVGGEKIVFLRELLNNKKLA